MTRLESRSSQNDSTRVTLNDSRLESESFLYCDLESFPDTSKVIQIFQIQIQTKNYIAKYRGSTKTESCLNPNSYHCYQPRH